MHRLYEYALIYQPKDKEKQPKMIQDVVRVLASSPESVQKIAARAIPEEYISNLDEVEIAIRPF